MLVGHEKQWNFLKRKFELNQLSHAYLFTGEEGIGKKTFAKEFTEFIGCKFPDIMELSATEKDDKFGDGGEIKIAKIREIQGFLSYKSYNGGYKVVIIDNSEQMNQEAQSCLLKTLEEPKGDTLLFLITSKPEIIMPTIFSRCQQIKFFKPKNLPVNIERQEKEKIILKDLVAILNSDFVEKFKYVKALDFEKQKVGDIMNVIQKHLRNVLLKKINGESTPDKYSTNDLKRILNLVEDINKQLIFTNASPKLALEILLMEI